MKISEALNWATLHFHGGGQGIERLDAEVILAEVTGRDRVALYRDSGEELPAQQELAFRHAVKRRASGEPLAYITGHREFMGLDFEVAPCVLIPRPETELLVETALEELQEMAQPAGFNPPVVVEVGTGSGAVAVSLAVMLKNTGVRIYATDISCEALAMARANAARHGVDHLVAFVQGDLLAPLQDIPGLRIDLLAANLPYIPSAGISSLMKDVRDYEPAGALDGGQDGLSLYRRLVSQAKELLAPRGLLLMEIDPGQIPLVRRMMSRDWDFRVRKDLAGRDRLVIASRSAFSPASFS